MDPQTAAGAIGRELISRASTVPDEATTRTVTAASDAAVLLLDMARDFDFTVWDQEAAVQHGRLTHNCAAALAALERALGADLAGTAFAGIVDAARARCGHSLVYAAPAGCA